MQVECNNQANIWEVAECKVKWEDIQWTLSITIIEEEGNIKEEAEEGAEVEVDTKEEGDNQDSHTQHKDSVKHQWINHPPICSVSHSLSQWEWDLHSNKISLLKQCHLEFKLDKLIQLFCSTSKPYLLMRRNNLLEIISTIPLKLLSHKMEERLLECCWMRL